MSENNGPWIAIYSKIVDSDSLQSLSCAERGVFLQSFFLAARTEYDCSYHGRTYHLLPGQFVTTLDDLARRCGRGCSVKIVRRTLDKLKRCQTWADGRADGRADAPRLITFINWSVYQRPIKMRADGRADDRAGLGQTDAPQHSINSAKNDALRGMLQKDKEPPHTPPDFLAAEDKKRRHQKFKIPHITFNPETLSVSGIDDEARRAFSAACPQANFDDCVERLRAWIIKKGVAYGNYWRALCTIGSDTYARPEKVTTRPRGITDYHAWDDVKGW